MMVCNCRQKCSENFKNAIKDAMYGGNLLWIIGKGKMAI
jgi:hypothetical protein